MDTIREGASGAAVEDIQERLASLGYALDSSERDQGFFGPTTANAVGRFRIEHELSLATEVDSATWAALVDESYRMGDRTLYLRLPNFHGHDVRDLQHCLNILGFSCGSEDGYYGVHTEAAVKAFQENVGLFADGMAFPDTFDAIDRLRHVWSGKPADGPHPQGGMGFARAASVLDGLQINLIAEDPISRNVAARVVNLARATTENSGIQALDSADEAEEGSTLLVLGCAPLPKRARVKNVLVDDAETLPKRIRTSVESSRSKTRRVRLELPVGSIEESAFTMSDAQAYAVLLLDAICTAFLD